MAIDALRLEFPVLQRGAYLNSGTCGPLATVTIDAIQQQLMFGFDHGRGMPYYERMGELATRCRAAWSRLLVAPPEEIALTVGASDGIARALALLDWQPGDVILTSVQEHPGVLGPLGSLVQRFGVDVREIAIHELPAVAAATPARLIVCSHVTWATGQEIALGALGAAGIPIVVDAAQSAGAIRVDLSELRQHGVVAYASAGQKWTCGPVGTGSLWVDATWAPADGRAVWPTYGNLADPASGLAARPWPDARRLDAPSLSPELLAGSATALELLESFGWEHVHSAAIDRAEGLAVGLDAAGLTVAPRDATTLVSWTSEDPAETVQLAADAGVWVRSLPGTGLVRASCGAWTATSDLEQLLDVVAPDR